MTDKERGSRESGAHDPEIAAELEGVPADMIDDTGRTLDEDLARLGDELDAARQDILYAKAETQNVRRRLEKEVTDARAYADTGFARDILSVADNLARALEAIPADLREDERMKSLIAGIEATGREIEKVFVNHGVQKVAAQGMPLDPNQHQAMLEVPHNEVEPGTVVQVLQHGYTIKDRLLRPAMVAVAKKPE